MRHRSKFKLTVTEGLFDAVCDAVGEDFANSYLPGAHLEGPRLMPRTQTGWRMMRDRKDFMDLIGKLKLTLIMPTPYPGNGDRFSAQELTGF